MKWNCGNGTPWKNILVKASEVDSRYPGALKTCNQHITKHTNFGKNGSVFYDVNNLAAGPSINFGTGLFTYYVIETPTPDDYDLSGGQLHLKPKAGFTIVDNANNLFYYKQHEGKIIYTGAPTAGPFANVIGLGINTSSTAPASSTTTVDFKFVDAQTNQPISIPLSVKIDDMDGGTISNTGGQGFGEIFTVVTHGATWTYDEIVNSVRPDTNGTGIHNPNDPTHAKVNTANALKAAGVSVSEESMTFDLYKAWQHDNTIEIMNDAEVDTPYKKATGFTFTYTKNVDFGSYGSIDLSRMLAGENALNIQDVDICTEYSIQLFKQNININTFAKTCDVCSYEEDTSSRAIASRTSYKKEDGSDFFGSWTIDNPDYKYTEAPISFSESSELVNLGPFKFPWIFDSQSRRDCSNLDIKIHSCSTNDCNYVSCETYEKKELNTFKENCYNTNKPSFDSCGKENGFKECWNVFNLPKYESRLCGIDEITTDWYKFNSSNVGCDYFNKFQFMNYLNSYFEKINLTEILENEIKNRNLNSIRNCNGVEIANLNNKTLITAINDLNSGINNKVDKTPGLEILESLGLEKVKKLFH